VWLRVFPAGRASNSRALLALIGLLSSISAAVPVASQATEALIEFDIPAQALDAALSAYGSTARTQLLFDPDLIEGRRANGLKGTFTAADALRRLLAGTGIVARMIGDDDFTLVPDLAAADPRDVSPMVRRFDAYSAAVQGAMGRALCRHEKTVPGSYRVLARVWIGASGVTDRAELLTSSGDAGRDAMVVASFRRLAIGLSPPGDLPQPVTLLVTFADTNSEYCRRLQRTGEGREAAR